MVAFTSNDSQVHPALVYLEDFSMLYPGQILSAMRLKICPLRQKIVKSRQTIRTCKELGDDRKFV